MVSLAGRMVPELKFVTRCSCCGTDLQSETAKSSDQQVTLFGSKFPVCRCRQAYHPRVEIGQHPSGELDHEVMMKTWCLYCQTQPEHWVAI